MVLMTIIIFEIYYYVFTYFFYYFIEYSPKLSDEDLITSLEQVELETADDREALENFLRSNSDTEDIIEQ